MPEMVSIDGVRAFALILARADEVLVRELVLDAWRMCVPRKVGALVP